MLIVGTFIKLRMVQYLRGTKRSTNTTIQVDDMVLFEQIVNAINGPLIMLLIVRILFPYNTKGIMGNIIFCYIWGIFAGFAFAHRAIGGFGIAFVRQVLSIASLEHAI